jgi:hypothetical protein
MLASKINSALANMTVSLEYFCQVKPATVCFESKSPNENIEAGVPHDGKSNNTRHFPRQGYCIVKLAHLLFPRQSIDRQLNHRLVSGRINHEDRKHSPSPPRQRYRQINTIATPGTELLYHAIVIQTTQLPHDKQVAALSLGPDLGTSVQVLISSTAHTRHIMAGKLVMRLDQE